MRYSFFAFIGGAIIACIFMALIVFGFPDTRREREKTDLELGCTISNLKYGEVCKVSNATHAYLFDRLDNVTNHNHETTLEVGGIVYYVSAGKNNYILTCPSVPVSDNYHLELSRTVKKINPAGPIFETLFFKKIAGPYCCQ